MLGVTVHGPEEGSASVKAARFAAGPEAPPGPSLGRSGPGSPLGTLGEPGGRPLPWPTALRSLTRCVLRTIVLLCRRRIAQPRERVGDVLHFADGSRAAVYRETAVDPPTIGEPVILVVSFRLRWVRGWGHALFRAESLLNTPLFVGFPGFVSKLWLAHDQRGFYRGFYQWDRASLAAAYVRALWWPLALVSERRSIRAIVLTGARRDDVLSDPSLMADAAPGAAGAWWRLTAVDRRAA